MNNNFSLQQISRTSNLAANLIPWEYKLYLVADFMRIKYENPKLKQSEIANQLGYSSSISQRYKNDLKMPSPYLIHPNNTNKWTKKSSNTNFDSNLHREPGVERTQMTSNDLVKPEKYTKSNKKNKNLLKTGSVHDNIEINEH